MTTKRATLTQHTVDDRGGIVAGFLVRAAGSGRNLGYIWSAGSVWRWRSMDASAHGERSTQRAAVDVVCDVAEVTDCPQLPFAPLPSDRDILDAWRSVERSTTPRAARTPPARTTPTPATPAPHVQQIVWGAQASAHDIRATIAASLKRKG